MVPPPDVKPTSALPPKPPGWTSDVLTKDGEELCLERMYNPTRAPKLRRDEKRAKRAGRILDRDSPCNVQKTKKLLVNPILGRDGPRDVQNRKVSPGNGALPEDVVVAAPQRKRQRSDEEGRGAEGEKCQKTTSVSIDASQPGRKRRRSDEDEEFATAECDQKKRQKKTGPEGSPRSLL